MSLPFVEILGEEVWLDEGSPITWTDSYMAGGPFNVWSLPCSIPPDPGDLSARVLAKCGQTVDFVFNDGNGGVLNGKGAYVIREISSPDPYRRNVLVSDPRAVFQRKAIKRTYNEPAATGSLSRGVTQPGQVADLPEQIAPLIVSVQNRLYSVQDGDKPWSPSEMLVDVLKELCDYASQSLGIKVTPRVTISNRGKSYPFVKLVGDPGDQALARLMQAVGMCDCRYDAETATVIVEDRKLGDEIPVVQAKVAYDAENWGKLRLCDMSGYRPGVWLVGWWVRAEVRADFIEGQSKTQLGKDAPWWDNVIPVTDQILTDATATPPAVYNTSMLMEFTAWLKAVNALGDYPAAYGPLALVGSVTPATSPVGIQQFFCGSYLHKMYCDPNNSPPAYQLWAPRIHAILSHYRQVFRLNPRFVSLCIPGSIRADRVAYMDPITRRQSPSPVFVDYFDVSTKLGFVQANPYQGANRDSWPWNGAAAAFGEKNYLAQTNIAQMIASPFDLADYDTRIGAFQLRPHTSLRGTDLRLIPSRVLYPLFAKLNGINFAAGNNGILELSALCQNFRFSTIISASPGGPNNENAWYILGVDNSAAWKALGFPGDPPQCSGPAMTLETKPGLDEARVQWDDDPTISSLILGLFETGSTGISATPLAPINKPELEDASAALVAQRLAWMLDHYVGRQRVAMDVSIKPVGSIHSVIHGLDGNGCLGTTINAEDRAPGPNIEGLMKDSTRQLLTGEVS